MYRDTRYQKWKLVVTLGVLLTALAIGCNPDGETTSMAVDVGGNVDTNSDQTDVHDAFTRKDADSAQTDASPSGNWEQVGGGGDRIDQFVRYGDRLYAERFNRGDYSVFRSDDGGETWSPIGSEGLDTLVASSEHGLSQLEYTRIDNTQFVRVSDKLYRKPGDDDWEQVPGRLPGRPGSSTLTSVADRLVYASGTLSNKGFVRTDILFSDDQGESWTVQREISRGRIGIRSWDEQLVVTHGKDLYVWRASEDSWQTHTSSDYLHVSNWYRIGDRFARFGYAGLRLSEDGVSWNQVELDEAAPSRFVSAYRARRVLPDEEAAANSLFAIGAKGRIGLVHPDGSWTSLTARSPDLTSLTAPGSPVPTGDGFVASIYGVSFKWSSNTRDWSLLDVSDRPLSPTQFAIDTNGEVSAVAGGQLVVAEPSGWRWRPEAFRNSVDRLRATSEGLWLFSSTECLYRRPTPSASFSPIVDWNRQGDDAPTCLEAMPWGHHSHLTNVVHLDGATIVGVDGETDTSGGHGSPRLPYGGGLYRRAEGDADWKLLGSESLPMGDDSEPWVDEMALHEQSVWVQLRRGADTGLFRSEDRGNSWQQVSQEIVDAEGNLLQESEVFGIEETDSRMYAGVHNVENDTWLASRTEHKWKTLDEQPPGQLRAFATMGDRLYAATSEGLVVRADGEESFRQIEALPNQTATMVRTNPPAIVVHFEDGQTWRSVGSAKR